MIKTLRISAAIIATGLVTGCANTSTLNDLQTQIDTLTTQISTASSDAAKAQTAAAQAAGKAAAAESAANRAARYAQDTNSKLDRMFKKSMMK